MFCFFSHLVPTQNNSFSLGLYDAVDCSALFILFLTLEQRNIWTHLAFQCRLDLKISKWVRPSYARSTRIRLSGNWISGEINIRSMNIQGTPNKPNSSLKAKNMKIIGKRYERHTPRKLMKNEAFCTLFILHLKG